MNWEQSIGEVEARFEELSSRLADPALLADQKAYQQLAKQHSSIAEVVEKYRSWKRVVSQIDEARDLLDESDPEMVEMATEEIKSLTADRDRLAEEIRILLLPVDPADEKGAVLEIRAGTGGDEATLFAAEIFRMYCKYAEGHAWNIEVTARNDSEAGGIKELIALVKGKKVYSRLKYESGVHRVQRVPKTESQGRVHTSAVTVAVLPEADEVDVQVDETELRIDTYCSSGPGGQSVNTTYSAVRITHLPTGLVVTCQDEKSQIKNRKKALQVLRSRLYEIERQKQHSEQAQQRRAMVRSGDRSEKIRTYNFPEMRITDHRIGLKVHQLTQVLDGDLDVLIEPLTTAQQADELAAQAA
ncbi:MAG: peptide chain release factor 1 [Bryobacterales bacterium]|nr:peptide chain release factor 1 [Bryobacterales bacterium]MDE0263512.1 peptide chain release factor 1 [Bryobacterales bacterium]MDE0624245.1 peptide chain release factor 1 [Bryobacterales bacterium]